MSEMAGSTVLVTGATGFLGGALVQRLSHDGVHVRALARRTGRDQAIRHLPNVDIVMGDITGSERLHEVMQGCDYVFHVAAALGGRLPYQYKVNIAGTNNVARAATNAGVRRLVHVSSIAVYGYQHRGLITEDMPHIPGNVPYNITKSGAEYALRSVARETGLSYSINRPGMIFGPRSHAWTETLFRLAKNRPVPYIGNGGGSAFPIYVDDVVDLMLIQATHAQAEGEAFNCVYQPQPTQREFLGKYMALVDNRQWRAFPVWMAKAVAPVADVFLHLNGEPQDIQEIIRMLESEVIYSIDKARHLLDWTPQTDLDSGIERCVPYLQEIGLL